MPFAQLSRGSREYQGHGWGCAWLTDDSQAGRDAAPEYSGSSWQNYHCIDPIWEDDLGQFGQTRLLLVHARSAFRDEGIVVENNMPFTDGSSVFIFNGELRGVKINSEGRIGAEKIYNYIRRMDKGDLHQALEKAVRIIDKRTSYVRAMNIVLSDENTSVVSTHFNEDPDYFQMYRHHQPGFDRVCSRPFPSESGWQPIPNNTTSLL